MVHFCNNAGVLLVSDLRGACLEAQISSPPKVHDGSTVRDFAHSVWSTPPAAIVSSLDLGRVYGGPFFVWQHPTGLSARRQGGIRAPPFRCPPLPVAPWRAPGRQNRGRARQRS